MGKTMTKRGIGARNCQKQHIANHYSLEFPIKLHKQFFNI